MGLLGQHQAYLHSHYRGLRKEEREEGWRIWVEMMAETDIKCRMHREYQRK